MGLDFSALIRYSSDRANLKAAVSRLLTEPWDPSITQLLEHGRREKFTFAENPPRSAEWRQRRDWEQILATPPELPSLDCCLDLTSGFMLTFAPDTIWLHHTIRWQYFLFEPTWQAQLLKAVAAFCDGFNAIDCVITHDENPAVAEVLRGTPFVGALQVASAKGEGAVASLTELHQRVDTSSNLAMKPAPGHLPAMEVEIVHWPHDRALPKGWTRPEVNEFRGYWHLKRN
jgi:hypothetical protein